MKYVLLTPLFLLATGCTSIHVDIRNMPGVAAKVATWQQQKAPAIKCPRGQEAYWSYSGALEVSTKGEQEQLTLTAACRLVGTK